MGADSLTKRISRRSWPLILGLVWVLHNSEEVLPARQMLSSLRTIAEPLQAQALVAKLAVERFVGAILPRLAGIVQRGVDVGGVQPAQDRPRHKLGSVVGAQIARRPMRADEA